MHLAFFLPVLGAALVVVAEENTCSKTQITTYYAELGCVPRKENNARCPTSYDCSKHENRDKTKCHYAGKAYNIQEGLNETPFGSCKAACRCLEGAEGSPPSFTCAQIECPFGGFQPYKAECHYLYQPDGLCCSSKEVCGESVKDISVTCEYDNKTYIEGERFYNDKACQVCHCKDNFDGRLENPFCYDLKCDFQLQNSDYINKGCVPVYFQDGCCPIDWQCPEASDKVRLSRTKERRLTNETCKFGTLVLRAGEHLETTNSNVECSCLIPPYLTCKHSTSS